MITMVSSLGCGVSARLGGCQAGVPHLPAAAASAVSAMRWMLGLRAMVVALHVGCPNAWVDRGSIASGMQTEPAVGSYGLVFCAQISTSRVCQAQDEAACPSLCDMYHHVMDGY